MVLYVVRRVLEQASTAGSRSVLPKINQKELSALTVVLPTLSDEQTEIVRILDDLLAKETAGQRSRRSSAGANRSDEKIHPRPCFSW